MRIKKLFYLLLVLTGLSPLAGLKAQETTTLANKMKAAETLYAFLKEYSSASDLKTTEQPRITTESAARYQKLFQSNAVIVDEITPAAVGDRTNRPDVKPIEQFIQDVEHNFPEGLQVYITKANINFAELDMDRHTAEISIEKIVSASTVNCSGGGPDNVYKSRVVEFLDLQLSADYSSAQITNSTLISGSINCDNCNCQVVQRYKFPYEFDITVMAEGSGVSAFDNTPDFAKLHLNTNAGSTYWQGFKSNIGYAGGANVSFDFMFGQNRNIGLGIDASYDYQSTAVSLDTLSIQYPVKFTPQSSTAQTASYVAFDRYQQDSKISETFNTQDVGVSLLFKYQTDPENKVGFFLHVGPSYNFFSETTSKWSAATVNEVGGAANTQAGTYQSSNSYNTQLNYTGGPLSSTAWIYSTNAILQQGGAPRNSSFYVPPGSPQTAVSPAVAQQMATNYFSNHASIQNNILNIQLNSDTKGTSGAAKFGLVIGGVLQTGVIVKLSETIQFLAGANVRVLYYTSLSAPSLGENYNSLISATENMVRLQYGLTAGIKFRIINESK